MVALCYSHEALKVLTQVEEPGYQVEERKRILALLLLRVGSCPWYFLEPGY